MRDVLGPGTILGYCTNVHAGATLEQIKANLETYALAVKRRVSPDEPMGVGLWFPALVADALVNQPGGVERLRDWLLERGLLAYTLNGFPYGDFHGEVVKRSVYLPDWSHPERAAYTLNLMDILHRLLPEGAEGSISTLPLGWSGALAPGWARNLGNVIDALRGLHRQTGRLIHLDLEPEPGCEIEDATRLPTLLALIDTHDEDPEAFRRHLRICHDICHGAVMFEQPTSMLDWSRASGIKVGKVQISSALRVPFQGRSAAEQAAMRAELEAFSEARYLHQTAIGGGAPARPREFFADLPDALAAHPRGNGEWRVHFHVPVDLESIGRLETTQSHIVAFLRALRPEDGIHHFEVESYAWNVLPPALRSDDLAGAVARELLWVRELAAKVGLGAEAAP